MRLILAYLISAVAMQTATAQAQSSADSTASCGDRIELRASMMSDARRALWRALTVTAEPEQSGLFRSRSLGMTACADGHPFLETWRDAKRGRSYQLLPVEVSAHYNSAYPRGGNDAAAWAGVGWTAGVTAGAELNWRFLRGSIAPEVYYQQNANFGSVASRFEGRTTFANPYHFTIDYPERFGIESFETVSPGQSFLQANAGPVSFTVGTENVWIGAAEQHPILLSYNAPGFPHLRIGTQKPIDAYIADIEFQVLFASLSESDYFDGTGNNDSHYFTTTMIVAQPHFLPGLHLGVARLYHDTLKATGHGPGFYLSRVVESPFGAPGDSGNRPGNAIAALLARWVLADSDFEAYVEWAREDTPGGWTDILREPDWSQAYVLGFQKAFSAPNRLVRLYGELIHLGQSAPVRAGRGFASYYTHSIVQQGHTNKGQLLGASIGPGSDAQLLGVDWFSRSGRTAVRLERTRYDDDTYYIAFARRYGETRHDAEITLSGSRMQMFGSMEIEAGVALSRRYDRDFLTLGDTGAPLVENNFSAKIVGAWRPSW